MRFAFCVTSALLASASNEVVVGNVRVQALSPTLVRVEPKGPQGFEDRTTFMVTGRNWKGVPISKTGETDSTVTLTTDHYVVELAKAVPAPEQGSCAKPVTGQDYQQTSRSKGYPDGLQVEDQQGCCDACDGDETCVAWVFDPATKSCWPLSDFSSPVPVSGAADRHSGCGSQGCSLALSCPKVESGKDAVGPSRSSKHPDGAKVGSRDECCTLCNNDPTCTAFVHAPDSNDVKGANCWPLARLAGTSEAGGREVGYSDRSPAGPSFKVLSPSGDTLYDAAKDDWRLSGNLLHWPSPLEQKSYALTDYPRFFVPSWGTVPVPAGESVAPELAATNGYDFRNNVAGDSYVFLLGQDLQGYEASRQEFLQLAGQGPLLPDYAYGTWYTAWAQYTYDSASKEVKQWRDLKLPISVWALDMNWRLTDNNKDQYYNYPNTDLFPNFTQWFEFLEQEQLRTYFNDHPFPVQDRDAGGGQCSPEETSFRWEGLSEWLARGLTFWWFDHNWGFSIPPPFVDNGGKTDGNWLGLDNAAWGSHVYYNAVAYFNEHNRSKDSNAGRPMTLTKFGLPDWRPGMDPKGFAESPAQHRFPVWWTGDGVPLQASVESMVDSGVHGFKHFVHSDCGGDYKPTAGDFLRWTAHCAFGSIHRYHDAGAGAHRPWDYDAATLDVTRNYLNVRARLFPSLIAAGQRASKTGQPIVARCDLFWPEHAEARTNQQYLFLDDVLVAPIWDSKENVTSRSLWLPPGDWEDAWDGSVLSGPGNITTQQPFERQPMWLRRGGFLAVVDEPALRVEDQDWSSLTLELFPSAQPSNSTRLLVERGEEEGTELHFSSGGGKAQVQLPERKWTLRLHLRPGQQASATMDGQPAELQHIQPKDGSFPLSGAGAAPPSKAGPVAELKVQGAHLVDFAINSVAVV